MVKDVSKHLILQNFKTYLSTRTCMKHRTFNATHGASPVLEEEEPYPVLVVAPRKWAMPERKSVCCKKSTANARAKVIRGRRRPCIDGWESCRKIAERPCKRPFRFAVRKQYAEVIQNGEINSTNIRHPNSQRLVSWHRLRQIIQQHPTVDLVSRVVIPGCIKTYVVV